MAYVGGMTSYGDSDCATYGVSTRADAYETWINNFIGTIHGPDCSADGACNPECAIGADPDCTISDFFCGDGQCDGVIAGEDCDSCPEDCPVAFNKHGKTIACCGNGICERTENKNGTCSADCL